jgi:hypothetical protein
MGTIYQTHCGCGFEQEVLIGHGFMSDAPDRFPFLCPSDGLVVVNLKNKRLRCPLCRRSKLLPYGEPPLSPFVARDDDVRPVLDDSQAGYKRRVLVERGNRCPTCGGMSLDFDRIGCFD